MTDSDKYFGWLFRITVSDDFFGWLFRMTISDHYSGCLFQMTVPDDYFGWLFRMPISDDFSRWLFVTQRLNRILATNSYFHGWFLFQPIIRLIGPMTDSFLNDGFLLQKYGPDLPWYSVDIFLINFFILPRRAEAITWENFVPVRQDPGCTKEGSRLAGMKRLTCNRRM